MAAAPPRRSYSVVSTSSTGMVSAMVMVRSSVRPRRQSAGHSRTISRAAPARPEQPMLKSPDRALPGTVAAVEALLWRDYLCPWCWLGRDRSAVFERHGIAVTHLPYDLHPEIPP